MNIEEIREYYYREPFQPFELELKDGRRIRVVARERIGLSPNGGSVFVIEPGDRSSLLRVDQIVSVRQPPASAA